MSMTELKENLTAAFDPALSLREHDALMKLSAAAGSLCRYPEFKSQ